MAYPSSKVVVRYLVWAYPGAPGLRTRVQARAMEGYRPGRGRSGRAEFLPLDPSGFHLRAIGYFNDTQHRNRPETEILREEWLRGKGAAWASVLSLEGQGGGLLLVKESHKCVNQPGYDTGEFRLLEGGVASTGWGLRPGDLRKDRFRGAWASWMILYGGGEDERTLALKRFDRIRYPLDPRRDLYIMANTWGSTANYRAAKLQAREANVLLEIRSQADLGIEVQQIDDGWQGFTYLKWRPVPFVKLRPKDPLRRVYPDGICPMYPQGWKRVRALAEKLGIRLGLWAAWTISLEDLIWNRRRGDFRYFKIDYAKCKNLDAVESLTGKARALILESRGRVRVNWDVTENSPRVGYFFGREYGSIYLENRKPKRPPQVVYVPYLVLRDAWQVAKYLNLNKFQLTVQNVDRVDRSKSDAWKHDHAYCAAQTLMGLPIFFQETHYYTEKARRRIRPLLALYKKHRLEMAKGFVFPVGRKPDNRSWSGFQDHDPESGSGYLTLFRQIENTKEEEVVRLHFLGGKSLELEDLRSGRKWSVRADPKGRVSFRIPKAGGFLFLRYRER